MFLIHNVGIHFSDFSRILFAFSQTSYLANHEYYTDHLQPLVLCVFFTKTRLFLQKNARFAEIPAILGTRTKLDVLFLA